MPGNVERRVDLHTHSNYSDGRFSPDDLVEEAIWHGLSAIALTDHDNVEGLDAFQKACAEKGIEGVNGVELSCEHEGRETHIVGLFVSPNDPFRETMYRVRHNRLIRMGQMLEKLEGIGIKICLSEIPQVEGRSYGRPHLARALIKKGIVRNIGEAFARYLGDDGPVYVPKMRFSAQMGINLIHEIGGVSVLAHPGASGWVDRIPDFAEMGVMAVEAPHPNHSAAEESRVRDYCCQCGLLVSGGSDFHGTGDGRDIGVPETGYDVLEALREKALAMRKES